MNKEGIISSALGAAFAASLCASTPAMALEAKQCLPIAEMNTALKLEDQHTMIIGDRLGKLTDDATVEGGIRLDRYANAVTSNADGSVGYQLEGDHSRAQASDKMCIRAKLTNIHIFDAARPGVPSQALLGGKFDVMLKEKEATGSRPMVIADTLSRAANGSERIGLPMVVTASVPQRVGTIYARQANGDPVILVRLGALDYTSAGLERARGTALASLSMPKDGVSRRLHFDSDEIAALHVRCLDRGRPDLVHRGKE